MDFFYNSSIYEKIAAIAFSFFILVQLYFIFIFYLKVIRKKFNPLPENTEEYPPVSVVICARNEEENLQHFLPRVLEQNYPNYEVVVVNDCSTDNTNIVLESLQKKYLHLRVTEIKEDEKFTHTKKLALTVGIKAAKNEWLVLTDADCFPRSNQWLKLMASNFAPNIEVVLGYGGYLSKKGLLNKFIRLDTLHIAMNYFGWAIARKPYMGVGRNLAYRKSVFFRNKGFANHVGLESGDDDLFVMDVANSANTAVEYRIKAHTLSVPRNTYASWIRQKRRHLSTSKFYPSELKFRLSLEPFSRTGVYLSFIVLAILAFLPYVSASIFIFYIISRITIQALAAQKFNEQKLMHVTLWWDLYSLYFYAKLLIFNLFTQKQQKWK